MKKRLLLAWRILVAAGMAAILFAGGVLAYEFIKHQRREKRYYTHTHASQYSDSYKIEWHKEKVRLKSAETGKYITPAFENLHEVSVKDTLTVFFQKNKRGFLDVYTGKIVIPAQYERAWIFSEGLGAVVKDGKLGFINKTGEAVIPFRFNWHDRAGNICDFLFHDGYCAVFDTSGKQGIIDKNGEWVVQPEYDGIGSLNYGCRVVFKGLKYGLLDRNFQEVFPVEYDNIVLKNTGIIVRKGSGQKLYAYDDKTILQPFVYDATYDLHYNSGKVNEAGDDIYVISDYRGFIIGGKSGLMDRNGRVVIPAIYEGIKAIGNDLFSCEIADFSYYYITINSKGEVIQ